MKKVPFDLTLAKQGVAFRLFTGDKSDNFYIADRNEFICYYYKTMQGDERVECAEIDKSWYHVFQKEKIKGKWAVVGKDMILDNVKDAEILKAESNEIVKDNLYYTVVKLAE